MARRSGVLSPAHYNFVYFTALYSHGTDENVKVQGATMPESLKAKKKKKNVFLTPKCVLLPLDPALYITRLPSVQQGLQVQDRKSSCWFKELWTYNEAALILALVPAL